MVGEGRSRPSILRRGCREPRSAAPRGRRPRRPHRGRSRRTPLHLPSGPGSRGVGPHSGPSTTTLRSPSDLRGGGGWVGVRLMCGQRWVHGDEGWHMPGGGDRVEDQVALGPRQADADGGSALVQEGLKISRNGRFRRRPETWTAAAAGASLAPSHNSIPWLR